MNCFNDRVLTEKEAKVYSFLVRERKFKGSFKNLAEKLNEKKTTLYRVVASLLDKEMIEILVSEVDSERVFIPNDILKNKLSRFGFKLYSYLSKNGGFEGSYSKLSELTDILIHSLKRAIQELQALKLVIISNKKSINSYFIKPVCGLYDC